MGTKTTPASTETGVTKPKCKAVNGVEPIPAASETPSDCARFLRRLNPIFCQRLIWVIGK